MALPAFPQNSVLLESMDIPRVARGDTTFQMIMWEVMPTRCCTLQVQTIPVRSRPRKEVKVVMQTDGNLVIYNSGMSAVWNIVTSGQGTSPYRLVLQTDGYAHSPVPPPHLVHWHGVLCVACEVMNQIYTAA